MTHLLDARFNSGSPASKAATSSHSTLPTQHSQPNLASRFLAMSISLLARRPCSLSASNASSILVPPLICTTLLSHDTAVVLVLLCSHCPRLPPFSAWCQSALPTNLPRRCTVISLLFPRLPAVNLPPATTLLWSTFCSLTTLKCTCYSVSLSADAVEALTLLCEKCLEHDHHCSPMLLYSVCS